MGAVTVTVDGGFVVGEEMVDGVVMAYEVAMLEGGVGACEDMGPAITVFVVTVTGLLEAEGEPVDGMGCGYMECGRGFWAKANSGLGLKVRGT